MPQLTAPASPEFRLPGTTGLVSWLPETAGPGSRLPVPAWPGSRPLPARLTGRADVETDGAAGQAGSEPSGLTAAEPSGPGVALAHTLNGVAFGRVSCCSGRFCSGRACSGRACSGDWGEAAGVRRGRPEAGSGEEADAEDAG